jgi:uncharacterized protein
VKVAVTIEYLPDKGRLQDAFQQHRGYLRTFLENGKLRAAGPFADDSGALWVLDVDTIEEAEQIVGGDPAVAAGVFVSWKIRFPTGRPKNPRESAHSAEAQMNDTRQTPSAPKPFRWSRFRETGVDQTHSDDYLGTVIRRAVARWGLSEVRSWTGSRDWAMFVWCHRSGAFSHFFVINDIQMTFQMGK